MQKPAQALLDLFFFYETGAWFQNILSDDINNYIYVKVTGVVGKTIRWVAYVRTEEVAQ